MEKGKFFTIIVLSFIFFINYNPANIHSEETDKNEFVKRCIEEGNRYLREGNYQQALRELERGLEVDPGNSSLNALITITKVQMKEEKQIQVGIGTKYFFSDPGKALKAWQTVLDIDSEDTEARENVKRLKEEINKRIKALLTEAEEKLQRKEFLFARDSAIEILKLDPESQQGEDLIERIKEGYIKELKEKLKNAEGHYYAGRYNKAIEILEDLVKEKLLDPIKDIPKAYMFIGYSYGAIGEEEKAVESFKSALHFNPQIEVSQKVPLRIQKIFYKARKEIQTQ